MLGIVIIVLLLLKSDEFFEVNPELLQQSLVVR